MDLNKYPFSTTLNNILKSTSYLSLATVDKKFSVWSNTLNFGFDNNLNLYFVSKTTSRHSINIKANPNVSATIFSTSQHPHKYVKGLQLYGTTGILNDDKLDFAISIMYGRNNIFYDTAGLEQKYRRKSIWKFFVIIPKTIYLYDTEYFGDNRIAIPKQSLILN